MKDQLTRSLRRVGRWRSQITVFSTTTSQLGEEQNLGAQVWWGGLQQTDRLFDSVDRNTRIVYHALICPGMKRQN